MRLHFPISEIRKGIDEELKTAKKTPEKYDWDKEKVVPTDLGFCFVGDQGVYLMPNTTDGKLNTKRAKHKAENPDSEEPLRFVIYAKECDPTKLDFDTWWENKRASWGGDDGVEHISLKEIEDIISAHNNPQNLVIDITPENYRITCA